MDARQLISASNDLLVASLPSSTDFMYHLLERQLIEHSALVKHKELPSTIQRIQDLITLVYYSMHVVHRPIVLVA